MAYDYVIKASYGNDSIALIQWMRESPAGWAGGPRVAVLYNDTGWASDEWGARVERGGGAGKVVRVRTTSDGQHRLGSTRSEKEILASPRYPVLHV